ncbi:MAG: hypothetical protein MI923_10060 [Phycisphaerales bacterium]|nr:hypothetical protein [Phycisphaerales bacterium]
MPIDPRVPSIAEVVETQSQELNQLATELSERIKAFEEWLNRLPGKVEAVEWEAIPDLNAPPVVLLGLRLHRSGKTWVLSYDYSRFNESHSIRDWTLLSEASVNIKIDAVKIFPSLLKKIVSEQNEKIKELQSVHNTFDDFAKVIGMTAKEEA